MTTHTAQKAFEKVLAYSGASLYRDACDVRYADEAANGTTTYNASHAGVAGIIDEVNDPSSSEQVSTTASFPELTSETRPAGFDTDGDGMPDAWELANGLNPNDASDATLYTVDSKGWYTNLEVYLNSLVENIVKAQNADADSSVDEYYPESKTTGITKAAVNSDVKSIEYYTLDGRKLSAPQTGVSIRKMTFANGQTMVDKVKKN